MPFIHAGSSWTAELNSLLIPAQNSSSALHESNSTATTLESSTGLSSEPLLLDSRTPSNESSELAAQKVQTLLQSGRHNDALRSALYGQLRNLYSLVYQFLAAFVSMHS